MIDWGIVLTVLICLCLCSAITLMTANVVIDLWMEAKNKRFSVLLKALTKALENVNVTAHAKEEERHD